MWYKTAQKLNMKTANTAAGHMSNFAEKYWKNNVLGVCLIPNVHQDFAYKLTDELITKLAETTDLSKHTATSEASGAKNAENQIRIYAMLAFREIGLRNYPLMSDLRIAGKMNDECELNHVLLSIREDVAETVKEIVRYALGKPSVEIEAEQIGCVKKLF